MLVYLLGFVWVALLTLFPYKYRFLTLFFGMLPFVVLSACRSVSVGKDNPLYYGLLQAARFEDFSSYFTTNSGHIEPLFLMYTKVVSMFSGNFNFLLFVTTMIIFGSLFFFLINTTKAPVMGLLVFLTMGGFAQSLSIMRQAIAYCLVLIAIVYMSREKKVIPFVLILIAGGFHRSAFIALGLLLLINIQFKPSFTPIVFFISLLFARFSGNIIRAVSRIFPYYANYLSDYSQSFFGTGLVAPILYTIISVTGLIACHYIDSQISNLLTIRISEWMLAISIVFTVASLEFSQLNRIADSLRLMLIFIIPNVIESEPKLLTRLLSKTTIIPTMILLFVVICILRPTWFQITPYSFAW